MTCLANRVRILKVAAALVLAGLTASAVSPAHPKHRHHHAAPKAKSKHRAKAAPKAKGVSKAKAAPESASTIVNVTALEPFLASLQNLDEAERQVVRVIQFGDSHTAADFWSGRVRRRLQDRFGDGGPGYLLPGKPWRGYPHAGVRFVTGQGWVAQSLRSADCDGWVGLTGASVIPAPGEDFKVQATFGEARISLLGPGGDAVIAEWQPLAGEGDPAAVPVRAAVPMVAEEKLREGLSLQVFAEHNPTPGLPGELRLGLPAGTSLLGVDLLSGRPGVIYDELGLNGAELTDLERWNPVLRKALLARARPDLIVLAYGTNDMGMSAAAQPDYEIRIRILLRALKAESLAPILVVGPLDRLGKKKRQRTLLAAGANWVIKALTQACVETGCAFWDARRAMGGYGSIQKWRKAGLAQNDLVHLNGAGYQRLGDEMADALLAACRNHKP